MPSKQWLVVYLKSSPDALYRRLRHDKTRPFAGGRPAAKLRTACATALPHGGPPCAGNRAASVATLVNHIAMQWEQQAFQTPATPVLPKTDGWLIDSPTMLAHRTSVTSPPGFAALAVLMAALLPALSHAVMSRLAATNGGLVEVCTPSVAWPGSVRMHHRQSVPIPLPWAEPNRAPGLGFQATPAWSWPVAIGVPPTPPVGRCPCGGTVPCCCPCNWPTFLPFHAPRLLAVWAPAHSCALHKPELRLVLNRAPCALLHHGGTRPYLPRFLALRHARTDCCLRRHPSALPTQSHHVIVRFCFPIFLSSVSSEIFAAATHRNLFTTTSLPCWPCLPPACGTYHRQGDDACARGTVAQQYRAFLARPPSKRMPASWLSAAPWPVVEIAYSSRLFHTSWISIHTGHGELTATRRAFFSG